MMTAFDRRLRAAAGVCAGRMPLPWYYVAIRAAHHTHTITQRHRNRLDHGHRTMSPHRGKMEAGMVGMQKGHQRTH